jgi:capsular exopolysaccharide synthesis family protein
VKLPPPTSEVPALTTVGWPGSGAMKPEILSAGPDPISLLHALRRQWPLAMGVGMALSAALAVAVWIFMPITYETRALFLVKRTPDKILDNRTYPDPNEYDTFRRTQQTRLKSDPVLLSALREKGVAQLPIVLAESDPVRWLEEEVVTSYPGDGEVLSVGMRGEHPDQMVVVLKALTKAFTTMVIDQGRQQAVEQRAALSENLARRRTELDKLRSRKFGLAKTLGVTDSEAGRNRNSLLMQQLNQLEARRSRMQTDLVDSQRQVLRLKGILEGEGEDQKIPWHIVEQEINKDPDYRRLKDDEHALENALLDLKGRLKDQDSPIIQLRSQQLDEKRQALQTRREELTQTLLPQFDQESEAADALAQAEADVQLLQGHVGQLDETIEKLKLEAVNVSVNTAELDSLQQEIAEMQTITTQMSLQLETMDIELEAPARVHLLAEPRVPDANSKWTKYMMVGMASVSGFGLGCLGIAFIEFRRRRLNSLQQITDGLGMQLIGTLPALKGRLRSRRVAKKLGDLYGRVAESMDGIRTALMHGEGPSKPRVVMVTSAEPHEGKSTVASQLAASLARSRVRTLLLDADIREPMAHHLMEMPLDPGMCEVLRGEADVDDVIRPTRSPGLWLLPAGQCDLAAIHELSTDTLGDLFHHVRQQFDVIIVDSGPVLDLADTRLVGQHVDAAILSVLRGESSLTKVYEATQQLEGVGIQVLGSVFNGAGGESNKRSYSTYLKATA